VARQTEFSTEELLGDNRQWLDSSVIPELLETLSNNRLPERQKNIASYSLFKKQLELTILEYTLGEDIRNVSDSCERTVDYLSDHLNIRSQKFERRYSQYILFVWLLSLCFLCRVDPKKKLKKIPFLGEDQVLDRLVFCFDRETTPVQESLFPKVFEPLCSALAEHEDTERNKLVLSFLDGYLPSAKKYDAFWYDSHIETDPNYYCHFGYWAFELAALSQDIEWWGDNEYREHPLYPKDLVDWKHSTSAKHDSEA